MFKKFAVIFLCLVMFVMSGCSAADDNDSSQPTNNQSSQKPSTDDGASKYTNPLTGIKELSAEVQEARPFAVMVNNLSIAQTVQAGLNDADIVYETEVEGGITRLMAVFKDVSKVGRIGTVRSARYPYVDLAMGHGAIYAHCGQDGTYCAPHLKDIDHMSIETNQYGERVKNGLASEHTLYTSGALLMEGAKKYKFDTVVSTVRLWANFAKENEQVNIGNKTCNEVSVRFSSSYITKFKYDESTKLYTRYFKDTLRKDYVSGETKTVTNVFVLLTEISNYPDGYHRQVALEGGEGYYISGGKYTAIKWKKGAAENGFTFTDSNGNELKVNAGKSWVCIADKDKSQPSFS